MDRQSHQAIDQSNHRSIIRLIRQSIIYYCSVFSCTIEPYERSRQERKCCCTPKTGCTHRKTWTSTRSIMVRTQLTSFVPCPCFHPCMTETLLTGALNHEASIHRIRWVLQFIIAKRKLFPIIDNWFIGYTNRFKDADCLVCFFMTVDHFSSIFRLFLV